MHLAEGVLPLDQALAWTALAIPVLAWSLHAEKLARRDASTPPLLMAGATSLLFAATLLPLPVPVVGATSHICMTPVLTLLIGVRRIVWPTFFVLLLQALFFAHGGLTTLGVNTITLGLLGPLAGVVLLKMLRRIGLGLNASVGIACGIAALAVYVFDAIVLAMALSDAAAPLETFGVIVIGFAPVQLPLAVLEAWFAVSLLRLLARRRADLLPAGLCTTGRIPRMGTSVMLLLMLVAVSGCSYQGIDSTVFSMVAAASGQPPRRSLIDLSEGELGLAMSILILFALGFVAGRAWERLLGGHGASSR